MQSSRRICHHPFCGIVDRSKTALFITSLAAPSSRRSTLARTRVMYLLCCLWNCQSTVEGGKLVLLINSDKKSKKQALQTKFYQNIFVIRCKIRTHPVLSPLWLVVQSKHPLENLSISLDYPVCTARKQTFYYKRFLLDWFFIIMLRLLRDKCQPHKENKSTFRSLYLHASSSWRGKSDLLKYLKYCPCTCRQSDQDDNINAIKTLFPLWLFNIAFQYRLS